VFLNVRADLAATLRKEGNSDEADQLLAGPVPPGPASNSAEPTSDRTSPYNDFIRAREYKDQGKLEDAELHYRLAINALDRFPASAFRPFPEDIALDELADICHAQHRDAEAEDLLIRALHSREKKVSEQDAKTNPRLAGILSAPFALQNFYRDQGRLSEIEPVYKRALEIQERYVRLTDDPVGDTLRNLASVYVEEKKFGERCRSTGASCKSRKGLWERMTRNWLRFWRASRILCRNSGELRKRIERGRVQS
jgi:tetratricopeptide (TPR) repeat protein